MPLFWWLLSQLWDGKRHSGAGSGPCEDNLRPLVAKVEANTIFEGGIRFHVRLLVPLLLLSCLPFVLRLCY